MEINVLIEEGIDPGPETEWIQGIVEEILVKEGSPPNVEISLVIIGQERMQELNHKYRGKDKTTDVLAFSLSEQKDGESEAFIRPPDGLIHLGEVLISYPQAVLQAKESGHSLNQEMAVLIIHGVLHILGYDHEKTGMAPAMKAREKEILESLSQEIS